MDINELNKCHARLAIMYEYALRERKKQRKIRRNKRAYNYWCGRVSGIESTRDALKPISDALKKRINSDKYK